MHYAAYLLVFFPFVLNLHEGRRGELLIAAALYLLGGSVTAYAPGLAILLIGRLLYGLGIGLVSSYVTISAFII